MGIAGVAPTPETFTSSTPPGMPPLPSVVKLPTRARGLTVAPLKTSPLVMKAYVPLKLASENLPLGGGGCTEAPPPQAASHRAAAETSAVTTRFIAHLAALPFVPESSLQRASEGSLLRCER